VELMGHTTGRDIAWTGAGYDVERNVGLTKHLAGAAAGMSSAASAGVSAARKRSRCASLALRHLDPHPSELGTSCPALEATLSAVDKGLLALHHHHFYLCHHRATGRADALRLQEAFHSVLGLSAFVAPEAADGTFEETDWEACFQRVAACDVLLLLQNRECISSPTCLLETFWALHKQRHVVTVLVQDGGYDFVGVRKILAQLPDSLDQPHAAVLTAVLAERQIGVETIRDVLSDTVPQIISVVYKPKGSKHQVRATVQDINDKAALLEEQSAHKHKRAGSRVRTRTRRSVSQLSTDSTEPSKSQTSAQKSAKTRFQLRRASVTVTVTDVSVSQTATDLARIDSSSSSV